MTMEIRDSRGRKVSLLNDDLPRLAHFSSSSSSSSRSGSTSQHQPHQHDSKAAPHHLPPTLHALPPLLRRPAYLSHSSTGSEASKDGRSPPSLTPSLCRSDSSDSAALSPSPPTPLSSGFEPLRQALPKRHPSAIETLPGIDTLSRRSSGAARSPMDFPHTPLGPSDFVFPAAASALPAASPYDQAALQASALQAQQPLPNPTVFDPQQHAHPSLSVQHSPSSASATAVAPGSAASSSSSQVYPAPVSQQRTQKKNSYPCPLSKQYNCPEYFTTSGHAARHAKKHTGKKDALCPECGKGFTRKDNMEQHRRTHANGRNGGSSNSHNSTSSSSSSGNNTASSSSNATSASSASSAGSKPIPKPSDSEESKARRKAQQQRKARPSSISTSASMAMPVPTVAATHSQPSTGMSVMPPALDMLDPALREQAAFFSPSSTDYSTMFPFGQGGFPLDGVSAQPSQHGFQAPHAPMRAAAQAPATPSRMRHEPRASGDAMDISRPRAGPTSPSLAPRLDALALAAEGVRRRDSNGSSSS